MNTYKPFSLSMKVVIRNPRGECLLVRRSASSKANPGKWEFPGGKIDPGETFDQALLREVVEETGLSVVLTRVVGAAESELPERKVAYLFMEAVADSDAVCLSHEHDDFAWVSSENMHKADLAEQFRGVAEGFSDCACREGPPCP